MLNGFHSNWSKPFQERHKNEKYFIDDFEILTTIISALKWKENNGSIKMVTDEVCANYYKYLGLDDIWDLGIEVILDKIDEEINADVFWAAGKIFALKEQKAPIVMIDTDLIVWKTIGSLIQDNNVSVIHKEDITDEVYPSKDYFKFKNEYIFDKSLDWYEKPCNTALLYISDDDLKDYYCNHSIEFMKNVQTNGDRIKYMVFAEQRFISMSAKIMKTNIQELVPLNILLTNNQDIFTHVWGYKDKMRNNAVQRKEFCIKCINRILKDFPEEEGRISKIKEIHEYYKLVRQYR